MGNFKILQNIYVFFIFYSFFDAVILIGINRYKIVNAIIKVRA